MQAGQRSLRPWVVVSLTVVLILAAAGALREARRPGGLFRSAAATDSGDPREVPATEAAPRQEEGLEYKRVAELARTVAERVDFSGFERPWYQISARTLSYRAPFVSKLSVGAADGADAEARAVEVQCQVEKFRKYPPPGATPDFVAQWAGAADGVVQQLVTNLNATADPGERAQLLTRAHADVTAVTREAAERQAANLGLVLGKSYGAGPPITILTDPPGAKVFMISDSVKIFADIRNQDYRQQLFENVIGGQTTYEGRVWYFLQWPDGRTSGPATRVLVERVTTLQ